MLSDETLIERIRAVNPIRDDQETGLSTAALLVSVEERSGSMAMEQVETAPVKPPGKRRNGLLVAVAAAMVVLLVGAALVVLTGSEDETSPATTPPTTQAAPPTTEAAPPTTEPVPPTTAAPATTVAPATTAAPTTTLASDPVEEAAALAVIGAAYELYNSGNGAAWLAVRDRGSFYESEADREAELADGMQEYLALHAAGSRIELIGCESQGLGEWPIPDQGLATGYYFTCETVMTDSFRDTANVELLELYDWVIADGEVVAVRSDYPQGALAPWNRVMADFFLWMRANQQEAWTAINYLPGQIPDEQSVSIALEYLDDFAATQG